MTQHVAVLGATGSIGDSTLALLAAHPERFSVYALSGHSRLDKLFALCQQFQPKCVVVPVQQVDTFAERIKAANLSIEVLGGEQGLVAVANDTQVDTVVAAIVGAAGLASTLAAAQAGKRILLANKEALVMAGSLMMQAVRDNDAILLPLDSEHNAIYQCLPAAVQLDNQQIHQKTHGVQRLWLTASGGPFLHKTYEDMQKASLAEAVKHPNWSMGQKISIDSATMMNKGLELIEACHLFDLPESSIHVVIHPQSIVHSLVEYCDGSFLAQMGSPDMKTPIAHALSYPERINSGVASLSLYDLADLQFLAPDLTKFSCLKLAREAMKTGVLATITLNAANEVAVQAFIEAKVKLTDIALINERSLDKIASNSGFGNSSINSLEDIMAMDAIARQFAANEVLLCQQ
ncbi:1-deoxy-D-xylulose-5-phosphate reductoisomerase [Psychrobacter sp. I-STPA10]|uniref:1-deoxy-D-xylulose-5-phosphate reductoisomerase n=1 Tax=Psychrobacter sp. I-STPA10 TaxID=2585769 RepID=UPI001E479267|nr:1-deoxy-D-xylulose-5-phosphate reductoisomerase [Psychrobacter sp. I-STPA10]